MDKNNLWIGLAAVIGVLLIAGVVWSAVAISNANDSIDTLTTSNDELNTQIEGLTNNLDVAEQTIIDQTAALDDLATNLETTEAELAETKTALDEAEAVVEEQETEAEIKITGKVIDDLFLGGTVSFNIDDNDLDQFFDGEIEFDDKDYDVHDEFNALAGGKSVIMYSGFDDEELGASPAYGLISRGALEYRYVFDDVINMIAVNDDEPLTIVFLGEEFQIISINANELEFRSGEEIVMREGQTAEVDGKEVKLEILGKTEAYIAVDGVYGIVDEYDSETINGLDIRLEDIVSKDNGLGVATLVIGEDTIITQKNNDEFLGDEDSDFKFSIESTDDSLTALVVTYDKKLDKVDDDNAPLFLGEELSFPYDFITVRFDTILNADYIEFDFEFDGFSEEIENADDIDDDKACGLISASEEGAIEILDEDVDEVYVCGDGTAYYQDTSGDWYEASVSDITLVNKDTEVQLVIGRHGGLNFEGLDETIRLTTYWADERLGEEDDNAESMDIVFNGRGIGTVEYDFLTPYGAVISTPEDRADNDEFTLSLPSDRIELELLVY